MITNIFYKARQTATISDYYKTHVGCVAVYQGNIISIGCNCNKTHPIQKNITSIVNHQILYYLNYMLKSIVLILLDIGISILQR